MGLSLLLIKALLKGYSLKNIRWLVRQWNNESAFSSSRLFVENKNPFGMSAVFIRPTTQDGFVNLSDGNTNGIYKTYSDAIKDRFLWDEFFKISPTSEGYAFEVSEKYHPSQNYFASVNSTGDKGYRTAMLLVFLPLPIIAIIAIYLKTLKII